MKRETAESQAKDWNCPYLECSAKANENIEAIFQQCVQLHLGDQPEKLKKKPGCLIL